MIPDRTPDFPDILEAGRNVLLTSDKHAIGVMASGYRLFCTGLLLVDIFLTPLAVDAMRATAARSWRSEPGATTCEASRGGERRLEPTGILWIGAMLSLMEQRLAGMDRVEADPMGDQRDFHAELANLLDRLDPYAAFPALNRGSRTRRR